MTELYQMTKNMKPSQTRRTEESGKKRRATQAAALCDAFIDDSAMGIELIFRFRFLVLQLVPVAAE